MTNAEYEAACITRAQVYDKFEGEHRVKQYDAKIAEIEGLLARLQEDRREIINRYDLNKLEHTCSAHEWTEVSNVTSDGHHWLCVICGKRAPAGSVIRAIDKEGAFMKEVPL